MRQLKRLAVLLPLILSPGFAAKKPKPPKPPTQPNIIVECITVSNIYSHSLGLLSGITSPEPGLEATIISSCTVTASVFIQIGYFDSKGIQFGDGIEMATVAAGAVYPIYHTARLYGLQRGAMKLAKVISVKAYPQ